MRTSQLDLKGLIETGSVYRNLPVAELVEMSLRRGESALATNGALVALTGKRTGRSPADTMCRSTVTTSTAPSPA